MISIESKFTKYNFVVKNYLYLSWKYLSLLNNYLKVEFYASIESDYILINRFVFDWIEGMAPNIQSPVENEIKDIIAGNKSEYKLEIVWRNVFIMAALHLSALYGLYLFCTDSKWQTIVFGLSSNSHRN